MKTLPIVYLLATAACVSVSLLHAQDAATAQPAAEATTTPAPPPTIRVVAEPSGDNEAKVSMALNDAPLSDVIKAFRDATGANIISGGTNLQGAVSVRLDNVPWKKGLSSILEPHGLELIEQPAGSGVYVVTPKPEAQPLITQAFPLEYARANKVALLLKSTFNLAMDVSSLIGTKYVSRTFVYADSTSIAAMSQERKLRPTVSAYTPANYVVVSASEQQLRECAKLIALIDKPSEQVYIEARFVEMTASASKKLGMKWDSLGSKDGFGATVGPISGGMEKNSGTLLSHVTPGTTVRDSATVLPGTEVADAAGKFNPVYVKEKVQNTLTPATINEASTSGRTAESMSWKQARGIGGQLSVDQFRLAMNAFEQIDGLSVFSNPKVIVANEEIAVVDMTTKEPNVEVNFQAATQQGQRDTVSTKLALIPGFSEPFSGEAFFSYGISLVVTPRINPITGLIAVDIAPSISDKIGSYTPSGLDKNQPVSSFPIINMKRLATTFSMTNGATAVIGGLTRTTEGNGESGIPWLRELPWIGPRLFGWKSRDKEQREIIIFVTVGIANPIQMHEDVGMPRNAVFGREVLSGQTKEPGERTRAELLSLEEPKKPFQHADTAAKDKPGTDSEAKAAQ